MRNTILSIILIGLFNFLSCSDKTTNCVNIDDYSIGPIIYVNDNFNSYVSDSISIHNVVIKNNILIIDYSYLGGCGDHQINLFAEMGFEETSPVQLRMRLVQHSYSDTCQNGINGEAYFDLKSAASLFRSSYHNEKGRIALSIYDSDLSNYYLPQPIYEF